MNIFSPVVYFFVVFILRDLFLNKIFNQSKSAGLGSPRESSAVKLKVFKNCTHEHHVLLNIHHCVGAAVGKAKNRASSLL